MIGVLKRGDLGQHSTVRASVIKSRSRVTPHGKIHGNDERGASVYTDAFDSYRGLAADFDHGVVDHGVEYASGRVHTNGLENFWSLLKRSLSGTYVSVDPFHMFRYLDEQVFRFNNRKTTDGSRFLMAARSIIGKRLTYKALIGSGLPDLETC